MAATGAWLLQRDDTDVHWNQAVPLPLLLQCVVNAVNRYSNSSITCVVLAIAV